MLDEKIIKMMKYLNMSGVNIPLDGKSYLREYAYLCIEPNKVFIYCYNESYHNGDYYATIITPIENLEGDLLSRSKDYLQQQCLKQETKLFDQENEQNKTAIINDRLNKKLAEL